jgi:penicillin amidase
VLNPREGFIASANDRVASSSFPYHISDLWEPPSRIRRLRDILSVKDQVFSVMDLERIQTDRFSHHAMEILPFIFRACTDSALGLPEEGRVLEYFRNWNFQFDPEDIATTLFQAFFVRLLENVFRDEMGHGLYHDYVMLPNVPIRVMTRLLEQGTSSWFDDVGTPAEEGADMIIRRSLRQAITGLRDRLGPDMKRWRWGELHIVTFQHPLGLQKPLDRVLNRGPYAFPGASTALVSGEYSFNNPFEVAVGPSFRLVVDMGDPHTLRVVLPPGESGHPFHEHYDDQTELWINGAYRIFRTDNPGRGSNRLILEARQ